jgi:hypothetical protein
LKQTYAPFINVPTQGRQGYTKQQIRGYGPYFEALNHLIFYIVMHFYKGLLKFVGGKRKKRPNKYAG